jgi:hypothetical protein
METRETRAGPRGCDEPEVTDGSAAWADTNSPSVRPTARISTRRPAWAPQVREPSQRLPTSAALRCCPTVETLPRPSPGAGRWIDSSWPRRASIQSGRGLPESRKLSRPVNPLIATRRRPGRRPPARPAEDRPHGNNACHGVSNRPPRDIDQRHPGSIGASGGCAPGLPPRGTG